MNIIKLIFKNPMTEWVLWIFLLVRLFFKHKDKNLKIKYLAFASSDCFYGKYNVIYDRAQLYKVSLGDFSYVGSNDKIARTSIGKFCCLGPEVIIGLGFHPTAKFVSSHPVFYSLLAQSGITFAKKQYFDEFHETVIENDVWVGARTTILGGVRIGNGAIIAANSVVTKDVPPYAIFGGVPAKLIRYRFTDEEIAIIESSKWWDQDIEWLKNNYKLLHDVKALKHFLETEHDEKNR